MWQGAKAVAVLSGNPHAEDVLKVLRQRQDAVKKARLTTTGHKRPMMPPSRPLAEAQEEAAELENQIRRLSP